MTSRARRAGAERGLMVVQGDFSIESGVAAVERLFKGKQAPTAVFCFNDEMAIGVLNAARQRGLVVPRDLSVIGFDDIRFAQYSEPPLTTVAQPMREIGERLVRMILDILEGGVSNPASITLPHRFGAARHDGTSAQDQGGLKTALYIEACAALTPRTR